MKTLTLVRFAYSPLGTFGSLRDETGRQVCFTVEEVWRDNIRGNSCIPEGHYRCRRGQFPRHGDAFEVMAVPGRSAILFHVANTVADIEGCIGPGDQLGCLDGTWAVMGSRPAYVRFMTHLTGETEFDLVITQHPGAAIAPGAKEA